MLSNINSTSNPIINSVQVYMEIDWECWFDSYFLHFHSLSLILHWYSLGLKYTKEILERGYFKCKAQNQICGAFKLVSFFWHIDMISSAYIAISYICHKWKNERIGPFWGRFLIDSKYLYKEKEICFGIIGQMWSRICMTIPTIIWHIISYGVLKMCAF